MIAAEAMMFTSASGMRTFQQKPMSWSIRRRGRVARIHMNSTTKPYVLSVNHRIPRAGTASTPGPCQPPNQSVAMIADTTVTSPYSDRKKTAHRIPEYSVRKPATSSDSASGRSNGFRFVSASAAMRYVRKAIGRMTTFTSGPGCDLVMSTMESDPT